MKILYLGQLSSGSTSLHRRNALQRLGHEIESHDPWLSLIPYYKHTFAKLLIEKTGFLLTQNLILKKLQNSFSLNQSKKYDFIWINGGELFGKKALRYLSHLNCPLILYNSDDPTGPRDIGRFLLLRSALKTYNLIVTVRKPTQEDLISNGCRNVLSVLMSYDEVVHAPLYNNEIFPAYFQSDVSFVGTYMRGEIRHLYIRALLNSGVSVKVFGDRWQLCPDKDLVNRIWIKGPLIDREYTYATAGSKICLGFLSQGNRDQYTRRSVEIPFAGGLLCAERTPEHLRLYRENEDAVFWNTPEELICQCKRLLKNHQIKETIRLNGMARVRQLGAGNETICQSILERAMQCQTKR